MGGQGDWAHANVHRCHSVPAVIDSAWLLRIDDCGATAHAVLPSNRARRTRGLGYAEK